MRALNPQRKYKAHYIREARGLLREMLVNREQRHELFRKIDWIDRKLTLSQLEHLVMVLTIIDKHPPVKRYDSKLAEKDRLIRMQNHAIRQVFEHCLSAKDIADQVMVQYEEGVKGG